VIDDGRNNRRNCTSGWRGVAHGRRRSGVSKDGTVLLNYLKMKYMFSLFAELHQTEELGPVLAIIPACTEAETMVHMMNKQVAAFLYYFLKSSRMQPFQ
jgi:hypothetical protein